MMGDLIVCMIFLLATSVIQANSPCRNITADHGELSETPVELLPRMVASNGSAGHDGEQNTTSDQGNVKEDKTKQTVLAVERDVHKYFSVIVDALGILTSIVTVITLHKGALLSSSAVYITGMGYANLLMSVTNLMAKLIYYESVMNTALGRTIYSLYAAYIFPFFFIAVSSGAWVILAFAIERCLAIHYPMKHYIFSSESRARKIVIAIFVVAFLTNITRFFRITVKLVTDPLTNESVYEHYYTEFGWNTLHNAILFWFYAFAVSLVPIPLLIVLTILIIVKLRSVRKKRRNLKEGSQGMSEGESKRAQIERVLVGSLLTFLFCNIPLASTVITVAIHGSSIVRQYILAFRVFFIIATICSEFKPILDFIMYVCCSTELHNSVKDLLLCRKTTM